jgi:hypothetical protein
MLRSPIQCPKCGAVFRVTATLPAGSARRPKASPAWGRDNKLRALKVVKADQKPKEEEDRADDQEDRIFDADEDEEAEAV